MTLAARKTLKNMILTFSDLASQMSSFVKAAYDSFLFRSAARRLTAPEAEQDAADERVSAAATKVASMSGVYAQTLGIYNNERNQYDMRDSLGTFLFQSFQNPLNRSAASWV